MPVTAVLSRAHSRRYLHRPGVRHHHAVGLGHVHRLIDGFTDHAGARAGFLDGAAMHHVDRDFAGARHRFADHAGGGPFLVLIVAHIHGDLARARYRFADRPGGGPFLVFVVADVDRHLPGTRHGFTDGARGAALLGAIAADVDRHFPSPRHRAIDHAGNRLHFRHVSVGRVGAAGAGIDAFIGNLAADGHLPGDLLGDTFVISFRAFLRRHNGNRDRARIGNLAADVLVVIHCAGFRFPYGYADGVAIGDLARLDRAIRFRAFLWRPDGDGDRVPVRHLPGLNGAIGLGPLFGHHLADQFRVAVSLLDLSWDYLANRAWHGARAVFRAVARYGALDGFATVLCRCESRRPS